MIESTLHRHELSDWLRLVHTSGLGAARILRLLQNCGMPESIFQASRTSLRGIVGESCASALLSHDPAREQAVLRNLEWSEAENHHLITLADERYPPRLRDLADPPAVLWCVGQLQWLQPPALAIVGSRHATHSGLLHAREFARVLGDSGLTIVSGLALGIDAAAHEGGLRSNGRTIAVVGHGLDRIYPSRNRPLGLSIASEGLLMSEFAVGIPPLRDHFPRRNRLIAALGHGVLVVEAARGSGSLITARQALDLGREVFAIPGSIDSPLSKGCHDLIRQGAHLVEDALDVLAEFSGRLGPVAGNTVSMDDRQGGTDSHAAAIDGGFEIDAAARLALSTIGWDPASVDELASRSSIDIGILNASLVTLELNGRISRLPDGRVLRAGPA